MADVNAVSGASISREDKAQLTVADALRHAWTAYIVMLILPFFLFMGVVVWLTMTSVTPNVWLGHAWFAVSMVWIGVAVPASFWVRARLFRAYWSGSVVEPHDYLRGMLTVWVTIEVGGILGLLGCVVSGSLTPCILPALLAFMLFTPFWPSGEAMVNPVGAEDDSEVFKHPR
jgi:hypothetical protein